jgi:flagellar FliL protein
MSEQPAHEEGAAEAKPKKSKKKLFIILGVVALVAGAGVPMFLMGGAPPEEDAAAHEEEEHAHEEEKHLETADLGAYVVNLSEATSFLKAKITVEFDAAIVEKQMKPKAEGEAAEGEGGGEHEGKEGAGPAPLPEFMAKRETQIKDAVLRILSSKKAEDVLTSEGKERLKEELIEGLNEAVALEEPPVTAVFFTEFIIQ